jgi:hypothetical protein
MFQRSPPPLVREQRLTRDYETRTIGGGVRVKDLHS